MLSEEFVGAVFIWVDDVYKRVCVFWKTCSKNHKFPMLVHPLKKLWNPGSNQNEYIADVPLNFNRQYNVRVVNGFKRWMN